MELVEGQELTAHVPAQQVPVVNHLDRDVAPSDTTFEEGTIEVPVHGEEIEVEKRARVREEVEIDKERVTGTQQVTDTVRREEAWITDHTETVEGGPRPRR